MVAIQNQALRRQRGRSFAHLFNEYAIGLLGAFAGEDLTALRTMHNQHIHFAVVNGPQGVLSGSQAGAEAFNLQRQLLAGRVWFCQDHSVSRSMSKANNKRLVFDKSPMSWRNGGGSFFTSVGAAMICSSSVTSGC